MTVAERRLWAKLRDRQVDGHKFRRQHPLGPYVLDFFCEGSKLVIEIDGGQHAEMAARDAVRTAWLAKHGCRVIRSWNNDVLLNIDGVLEAIRLELAKNPLPSGEGASGASG